MSTLVNQAVIADVSQTMKLRMLAQDLINRDLEESR